MKKYLSLLGPLALLLFTLAGCGGGGDTPPADNVLKTSADGKIALVGAEAALPAGVTPASITLVPHVAADLTVAPPAGATFAAAVECSPSPTTFLSPVTLRFTLATPPAAGENLVLYMLVDDDSNVATPDVWQMVGGGITVDGNVVSVQVTHFSTFGLFVTANAVLPANKYFRFDTGVYNGGMPGHIQYSDEGGIITLPHAQLLPLSQSYESITTAPFGAYKDSNAGPTGGYFPAATDGAVFAARVPPMGSGVDTYYKMQIISHTLHGAGVNDWGNVTFKYARILAPVTIAIDGEWSFPSGAHLSVFPGGTSFDLTPTAGATVTTVDGYYTAADTLVGTWVSTATSVSGPVTATFALVGGKLNATFVGTGPLDTVTLTGGTK